MLRTIEEICQKLRETHDPESIILFGSRARGTATQSSDFDLLVVQSTRQRPIDRRIAVEKALIIEKGDAPEKVHDIVELLRHAERLGWTVAMEMDDAILLNTKADAARALKAASAVSDSARRLVTGTGNPK